MSDNKEHWYAARTRKDQELSIRKSLQKLEIEHFLPTHIVVRQFKDYKKRVEVPVIRNLIFIRATKETAMSIPNDYGIPVFYIRDCLTRSSLIVPDKQMQDFMFVMDLASEKVTFDEADLTIGTKVQVTKGEFCGIEGELASIGNRSYVSIRIPQLLSVSIRIPKSHLKIIK